MTKLGPLAFLRHPGDPTSASGQPPHPESEIARRISAHNAAIGAQTVALDAMASAEETFEEGFAELVTVPNLFGGDPFELSPTLRSMDDDGDSYDHSELSRAYHRERERIEAEGASLEACNALGARFHENLALLVAAGRTIEQRQTEAGVLDARRRADEAVAAVEATAIAFLECRCSTPADLALKLRHLETADTFRGGDLRQDFVRALAMASLARQDA